MPSVVPAKKGWCDTDLSRDLFEFVFVS